MLQLFKASFNIGITLILIAFISITLGWYGVASVVGVIGAVLAIIGLVPVLLILILGFLYEKDVNNSTE